MLVADDKERTPPWNQYFSRGFNVKLLQTSTEASVETMARPRLQQVSEQYLP